MYRLKKKLLLKNKQKIQQNGKKKKSLLKSKQKNPQNGKKKKSLLKNKQKNLQNDKKTRKNIRDFKALLKTCNCSNLKSFITKLLRCYYKNDSNIKVFDAKWARNLNKIKNDWLGIQFSIGAEKKVITQVIARLNTEAKRKIISQIPQFGDRCSSFPVYIIGCQSSDEKDKIISYLQKNNPPRDNIYLIDQYNPLDVSQSSKYFIYCKTLELLTNIDQLKSFQRVKINGKKISVDKAVEKFIARGYRYPEFSLHPSSCKLEDGKPNHTLLLKVIRAALSMQYPQLIQFDGMTVLFLLYNALDQAARQVPILKDLPQKKYPRSVKNRSIKKSKSTVQNKSKHKLFQTSASSENSKNTLVKTSQSAPLMYARKKYPHFLLRKSFSETQFQDYKKTKVLAVTNSELEAKGISIQQARTNVGI